MRTLVVAGILCAGVAVSSPARADFDLQAGVKWLPANYTMPVSTTGVGMTAPLQGWNTGNLNGYLGFFFLDGRVGFQIGLDLGYSSLKNGGVLSESLSYTQFGFSVGGKFYMRKPDAQKVAPYVFIDFYKYFANISTSDKVPDGYTGFLAGQVSPLGFDLAVGAEYFFTRGFSIGAEIFGLRYGFTTASYSPPGGDVSATQHYLSFYSGLSLNYRFEIKTPARSSRRRPEAEPTIKRPRPTGESDDDEEEEESTPPPVKKPSAPSKPSKPAKPANPADEAPSDAESVD
jgi:hypothetical protein